MQEVGQRARPRKGRGSSFEGAFQPGFHHREEMIPLMVQEEFPHRVTIIPLEV